MKHIKYGLASIQINTRLVPLIATIAALNLIALQVAQAQSARSGRNAPTNSEWTSTSVDASNTATNNSARGTSQNNSTQGASSQLPGAQATGSISNGGNINDNAKKSQSANQMGQVVNGVVGAAMTAAGTSYLKAKQYGAATMAFGMAAMSFAQMAQMGQGAAGSGKTMDLSGFQFDPGSPFGDLNNTVTGGMAELKKQGYGYDFDKNKVVTPKGLVEPSAFASKEGALAAGLGPQGAAAVDNLQAQVKAESEKAIAKLEAYQKGAVKIEFAAGGGGSGSGPGGSAPAANSFAFNSTDPFKRNTASVAGMKIIKDGSPVGVALDNIFEMVSRKYAEKRSANQYVKCDSYKCP